MTYLLIAVAIIILAGGLFVTISLASNSDQNYDNATKGNLSRLTYIYIALVVFLAAGLGLYIWKFV
ncbi:MULTISPECIES: hypothetical protein [Bacillus]|uniref:hypothetical protein n=1 Tax=Bacillus TaxID=1386 RepID=UPI000BB70F34|nr:MULTISPECIES: hypothetical protein [Bacillus]